MKRFFFILTLIALLPVAAFAQDRIYRCGNEYTNNERMAREKGCRRVEGGNVTVLETNPRVGGGSSASVSSSSPPNAPRVTPAQQTARDSDAKAILNAELMRAETRLDSMRKEYSEAQPDNPLIEDLKANVARAEADVEGIKRELARFK